MNNSTNLNESRQQVISTTFGTIQFAHCPWLTPNDSINPDDLSDWD